MMDDMFLYHASNFFERFLSCANSHVHIHIMMDDVYIYHAQGRPWGMAAGATAQGPGERGAHDGVYKYNYSPAKNK